jgi:hypothetical protein
MAYAKGKYSQSISDRSGQAFPYREMVKEWNGSWVHISEFEAKHPQLDPPPKMADPQALWNARPQRCTRYSLFRSTILGWSIYIKWNATFNFPLEENNKRQLGTRVRECYNSYNHDIR